MKITKNTYSGPDKDGETNYDTEVVIENKTEHVIELIKTSSLVLNKSGLCLSGSYDNEHDVFIDPGESDTINTSPGWAKGIDKSEVAKTKVSVDATLFRREFSKVGVFEVQEDHKTIILLDKTLELSGGNVKVYGACLRRDKPDADDGTVLLTACLGVRNVSNKYIERFSVKMVLIDQEEAILEESTEYNSIPPNMGLFIEPSIYGVKKGRLRNCSVRLGISLYTPVGALSADAVVKEDED